MDKYRNSLIASIQEQVVAWFDQNAHVSHTDIYRFLHSIKGTAATIGLDELSLAADQLLDQLQESGRQAWPTAELREFLFPLIQTSYQYDANREILLEQAELLSRASVQGEPMVLILDDDPTLLKYLKEGLEKQGWVVIATIHPAKAVSYFYDLSPDCFIVDINIPHLNGFQVIELLHKKIMQQFIPTTIISVNDDKLTRLRAYELGADDFLAKPIDMEELCARMARQLEKKRRLNNSLFIDELTGAYNRKYLHDSFERQLASLKRTGEVFSIAVIDLDFFKQINDQYGHLAGDQVLAGFARYIKQNVRNTDELIRYGGEEFALLLHGTNGQEAELLLNRLREGFAQLKFSSLGEERRVTFSAGVAEITNHETTMLACIELADQALYRAKELGRNRVEIAVHAAAPAVTKKVRVAIVDDDAMIRSLLAEYVKGFLEPAMQVDLRTFRDGVSFLNDPWHQGGEPYLIILDGIMPEMDGLEVLQRLRQLPESERYRIVMLTGRKEEQDILKALELGADDYLTKPFSLKELETRVKRLAQGMK